MDAEGLQPFFFRRPILDMINRRGFLKGLGILVGGMALEEAIPLGRVWSFPSRVIPAGGFLVPENSASDMSRLATIYYNKAALDKLAMQLRFSKLEELYQPLPSGGKTIRIWQA